MPHTWLDVDDRAGQALARAAGIAVEDLPAVITPTAILRRATAGEVADLIGLAFRADDRHDFYLVEHGYLERVKVGGGRASTRWRILIHMLRPDRGQRPSSHPDTPARPR